MDRDDTECNVYSDVDGAAKQANIKLDPNEVMMLLRDVRVSIWIEWLRVAFK